MIKTITDIEFFPEVAIVTLNNIPNTPSSIANILSVICLLYTSDAADEL